MKIKIKKIECLNIGFVFLFFMISMFWVKNGFSPAFVYVFISVFTALLLLILSRRGARVNFVCTYICFVVSLWFFSSFIRRYGDIFNGWSELNVYGLAPILATMLSLFFINSDIFRIPKFGQAWLIMLFSLVYALLLGVVNNGLFAATYSFLTWVSPLVIFIYIVSNYGAYERMLETLAFTIILGLLVLGGYGIYQYFLLPPWDQFWIINVPMTSVGRPFPMGFRVFSLSNSPMVFAPILSMLLIFAIAKRSTLSIFVVSLGLVSLFLTLVRAAWLGLFISFILYLIWLYKNNLLMAMRFLFISFFVLLIIITTLAGTDAGQVVSDRLESIYMLDQDVSYNARAEFYAEMAFYALTNLLGDGMGAVGLSQRLSQGADANTTFDNGFLEMLVTLGWFGTILYMYSFIFFFKKALTVFSKSKDNLLICFAVIVISMFIQMVFSNRLIGPVGFFFFLFFAFLISGYIKKYHVDSLGKN